MSNAKQRDLYLNLKKHIEEELETFRKNPQMQKFDAFLRHLLALEDWVKERQADEWIGADFEKFSQIWYEIFEFPYGFEN